MIRFVDVTAQAAPYILRGLSLELRPGAHAIVGTPADGGPLLLAVSAGWVRTRTGQVVVLDSDPRAARPKVAYVPLDPRLPARLRVTEALEIAGALRSEGGVAAPADPLARLAALGVDRLATRWTESLTAPEARAVLLAEAVTSRAGVILIDEPFVDVDPRAAAMLSGRLRERAEAGVTVVVSTSSPRDALELASQHWLMSHGRLVGVTRAIDLTRVDGEPPRLRIVASDARLLMGALARDGRVTKVELDERALSLSGEDAEGMADAVAQAVLETGSDVESMHLESVSLDVLRTAAGRKGPGSARPPGGP